MVSVRKTAGLIAIIAALQFLIVMLYAESIVPGFDPTQNYISDLGIGSTAALFNSSLIIAGILTVALAILLYKLSKNLLFAGGVLALAISIMCIGIFPENVQPEHYFASYLTFLLGPLAAIGSFWFSKKPWKYLFAALGIISLTAAALLTNGETLGIGIGFVERVIVYPFLIWGIAFGVYLFREAD